MTSNIKIFAQYYWHDSKRLCFYWQYAERKRKTKATMFPSIFIGNISRKKGDYFLSISFDMLNEHRIFSNNSTAFQGSSAEKSHTRKVVSFNL